MSGISEDAMKKRTKELVIETKLLPEARVTGLLQEANELTAIFNASHKTANLNARQFNRKSELENRKLP